MKKPLILETKNNLTCILNPLPLAKSFSCGILVGAGSFTESIDTIGFSHFVEHMVFKGTKTRSYKDINREIEKYGGYINAFTDRNYTFFYTKIIPQFYEKSVEILFDIVFNPIFPQEEMKKEIKVVLEEIAMYEDSPDDNIVDLLFESSYPNSYLGWPILGTPEKISTIKREDLINYWENFYCNKNMIISAAGNFQIEKFLSLIEKIEIKESKIKEVVVKEAVFKSNKNHKFKDVEQLHIGIGKETINIYSDEKDKYSLYLLNSIIGANTSSRLYSKIREEMGLCYSINSSIYLDRNTGLFSVFTATDPKNSDVIIDTIVKEIELVNKEGIKEEELEIAKAQMKASIMFGQENVSSIMKKNASQFFWYKKIIPPNEILKKVEKITLEDIYNVYEKTFSNKEYSIYKIIPE